MRRFLNLTIVLAVLVSLEPRSAEAAAKKTAKTAAQTYTVMVGWENPHEGVGINAYFPETVTIHIGDTVHWVQNSNEIHTVSFLAGQATPEFLIPATQAGLPSSPSALVYNPLAVNPAGPSNGKYDGSIYANSGLMGREEGQVQEYDLTFTKQGTYDYLCIVHGAMMSGHIVVAAANTSISSAGQAMAQGQREMARKQARIPSVLKTAQGQVKSPVKNADGTTTYTVLMGYAEGQIDLMKFFPEKLKVDAGDTVVWQMSPKNMAPHTVTFLNGEPGPDLTIPVPQSSGSLVLYANPAAFFPNQPKPNLTRTGIYNSGVIDPVPGKTYTLVIGDEAPGPQPYVCLLHDESGMKSCLMVAPLSKAATRRSFWRTPGAEKSGE